MTTATARARTAIRHDAQLIVSAEMAREGCDRLAFIEGPAGLIALDGAHRPKLEAALLALVQPERGDIVEIILDMPRAQHELGTARIEVERAEAATWRFGSVAVLTAR